MRNEPQRDALGKSLDEQAYFSHSLPIEEMCKICNNRITLFIQTSY
jgi:hypothetical protein